MPADQNPSDPLSDEDIEDRIDAAQLSRSYRMNKVRGFSRYREYQEKRFGRKVGSDEGQPWRQW